METWFATTGLALMLFGTVLMFTAVGVAFIFGVAYIIWEQLRG